MDYDRGGYLVAGDDGRSSHARCIKTCKIRRRRDSAKGELSCETTRREQAIQRVQQVSQRRWRVQPKRDDISLLRTEPYNVLEDYTLENA